MSQANRDDHVILGVHLTNRLTEAVKVQQLFTRYGGYIKVRLGLHAVESPVGSETGSPNGLVLLEMVGNQAKADELAAKLSAIAGVEVKSMTFGHK